MGIKFSDITKAGKPMVKAHKAEQKKRLKAFRKIMSQPTVNYAPKADPAKSAKPTPNKTKDRTLITLRVEDDVLAWFKSHGRGWQTTINKILRDYMESGK
jgi:uncharacterized protein (DUF4415 family)